LHSIFASGTIYSASAFSSLSIPSANLIGGIDVYRKSPDDPVDLNKDWYAVISVPNDDSMFLVVGPYKDSEHWLNEIPGRLQGAEILGVPSPLKPN